jgi:signal transduction histidine kinase
MFSQIENPMTRRFGGTGVGLPLTRALVALHGGAIEVDSAPGAGTRVTVLLPPERVLA